MDKEQLRKILADQKESFLAKKNLITRDLDLTKALKTKQIVLISGIRRSGKSSLLKLIHEQLRKDFLYFNFDDERIIRFGHEDFNKLYEVFLESDPQDFVFYFDEIQVIPGWEKFLNRMYEQGIKIFVTGSNAKLLSSEIATALTGRNTIIHLSPFSFKEFLRFHQITPEAISTSQIAKITRAFQKYCQLGGFPLVVTENDPSLIQSYYSDIFYRDIVARYKIQNVEELKTLATYLINSSGRDISYSKMIATTGISSNSLIKQYLEYFLNAFLFIEIKKFDYSFKKQILNPRKFYPVDIGFINQIGFNTSENKGKILENLVLIELNNTCQNIFYYRNKCECDFVIKEETKITQAIQVCYDLNDENDKREIKGLVEACKEYKLKKGLLLTYDQEDIIKQQDITIHIKPVWKWLLE